MSANERRPTSGRGGDLGKNFRLGYETTTIVTPGADATWITRHPIRWRVWRDGYESGIRDGYDLGVDHTNQAWTDVTTAACRMGLLGVEAAERQRRRREPTHSLSCRTGPMERHRRCDGSCFRPRTAAEILADAAASWADDGGAA